LLAFSLDDIRHNGVEQGHLSFHALSKFLFEEFQLGLNWFFYLLDRSTHFLLAKVRILGEPTIRNACGIGI